MSTIQNFRLVSLDELVKLPYERLLYVVYFDCEGQLARIGHSRTPGLQIPQFIKQAAPFREIWVSTVNRGWFDSLARHLREHFADEHVRNGYFRVPMADIDHAVTEYYAMAGRAAA